MSKYFGTPFANTGDQTSIPDASQPSGAVSFEDGYTPDYSKGQDTDPAAKDVPRQSENYFKFVVTDALKELQEYGFKLYDALVNYPVNSRTIGSDGRMYKALIINGPDTSVVDPVGNPATWEKDMQAVDVDYDNATSGLSATDIQGAIDEVHTKSVMVNRVINGSFVVNQRAVTGTVILAAGEYGHDRWRAGVGGCTYTFTTALNVTTITITAGTLEQEIEGINLQSGDHVLQWSGTAQGQIDGGGFGPPNVVATLGGGVNSVVEFNVGTLLTVQLEHGSVPTTFGHRLVSNELALCERYYHILDGYSMVGTVSTVGSFSANANMPTEMRVPPTVTLLDTTPDIRVGGTDLTGVDSTLIGVLVGSKSVQLIIGGFSGMTTAASVVMRNASDIIALDAEL